MKCERVRDLFSEYIHGGLDHELMVNMNEHFDVCMSCANDFKLFKQTWGMLGSLPEVEVPAGFRHDVVMRIARLQHEGSKRNVVSVSGSVIDMLVSRLSLSSMRGLALTCAAALLAAFIFKMPQAAYQYVTGALTPGIAVSQNAENDKVSSGFDSSPLRQLDTDRKREWISNKLSRNIVWISIQSNGNMDGRMLYRVLLSFNQKAQLEGDTTHRIGAKVYLMPPGAFIKDAATDATPIWDGSIVVGEPIQVPVIVDKTQTSGSVNLLVTWRFHKREFSQLVIIPSNGLDSQRDVYPAPIGGMQGSDDMYSVLQKIAQYYGVPIIVNANLEDRPVVAEMGRGGVEEALTSALKPNGLDWLVADQAVYVDRRHSSF